MYLYIYLLVLSYLIYRRVSLG